MSRRFLEYFLGEKGKIGEMICKEVFMEDTTKCADSNCHRQHSDVRKGKEEKPSKEALRQQSCYGKQDKAVPDNSPFFEGLSNPLSSKGN